jgi:tetratricopeptide (TPR) repeat protein
MLENGEYSRAYEILAEFADWEHRYDELVELMRDAVALDSEDAHALGQLGINLIRSGQDQEGVRALARSFDLDPYNVRVFNTLELYEKTIPREYVDVSQGRFTIRYPVESRALLERYVPGWLADAFGKFERRYGFAPETPTGVELYHAREHFSVRTSGLPVTAIQGVCFGRTLATMAPGEEKFNVGMTLWHELAHVFHIQQSRHRVPRWFTEGLAEYETLVERPEWAREQDPDLFQALREDRLPELQNMTRAFTRAEDVSDVAMAYYASARIISFLADRFGADRFAPMLEAWAKSDRTPEVLSKVLGTDATTLDREFRAYLDVELARYSRQLVPLEPRGPLDAAEQRAKANPNDASALVRWALLLFEAGKTEAGKKKLEAALTLDPKQPDARFARARLAAAEDDWNEARELARGLQASGHDGYAVQMLAAEAAARSKRPDEARKALESAARFDPSQSAPLYALLREAVEHKQRDRQLDYARKLAKLEQHDSGIYRLLLSRLVESGATAEAVEWGEAAVNADIEGFDTHRYYAAALRAEGDRARAIFEYESALLCPSRPKEQAAVHVELADLYAKMGKRAEARSHAKQAREGAPGDVAIEGRLRELRL